MSAVRAVVFDLDGTLVDSRADIVDTALFTLAHFGRPPLGADVIASYVGDGARNLVARLFAVRPEDPALTPILSTFVERHLAHGTERTTLMAHAAETVAALAHLPLALCTNKPRGATDLVLAHVGLADTFRVIVGGDELPVMKPDPAVLAHVARELGEPPEGLVMVGDGTQDVECGRRAGTRTVAVLGGFASETVLRAARPDVVLPSLRDLPEALRAFDHATSV